MSDDDHPFRRIPKKLINKYTLEGKIPIQDFWCGAPRGKSTRKGMNWNKEMLEDYFSRFQAPSIRAEKEGSSPYGHDPVVRLLDAFLKHTIRGKKVAVIGSLIPWIEAMLYEQGNDVTTIEYNVPQMDFDFNRLRCRDYFDYFEKTDDKFDAIVTFSSVEHSGLGRYGDPLDPEGDLKTMKVIHDRLKDDGLLIWGAPVGPDVVAWNAHRVYGPIRLPLLFKGFQEIDWIGSPKKRLFNLDTVGHHSQPVVVLRKV